MNKQEIEIIINDDGSIDFETFGIFGEMCEEEVMELLKKAGIQAEIVGSNKTPEYYQKKHITSSAKNNRG